MNLTMVVYVLFCDKMLNFKALKCGRNLFSSSVRDCMKIRMGGGGIREGGGGLNIFSFYRNLLVEWGVF